MLFESLVFPKISSKEGCSILASGFVSKAKCFHLQSQMLSSPKPNAFISRAKHFHLQHSVLLSRLHRWRRKRKHLAPEMKTFIATAINTFVYSNKRICFQCQTCLSPVPSAWLPQYLIHVGSYLSSLYGHRWRHSLAICIVGDTAWKHAVGSLVRGFTLKFHLQLFDVRPFGSICTGYL